MKHMVFQNLTAEDLKPGNVVKLRNGEVRMVIEIGTRGTLILLTHDGKWHYLSKWNGDLTANSYMSGNPYSTDGRREAKQYDIMEVYGHVNNSMYYSEALDISTKNRPLLWSREPVKQMTLSEIEERLGFKIEVVAEK